MVLGIILLLVALVCLISFVRQLKLRNNLAIAFSALSALAFGFFSIATIISEISGS